MKIQYISDIHLEFWTNEELLCSFPKEAEILVLAGDIGYVNSKIYIKFLKQCSEKFEYVIIIMGNHEYYNGCISQTEKKLKEFLLNYSNIYFLQNSSIEIEGIIFYGCTLWTHIPTMKINTIKNLMSDYKFICDEANNLITPFLTNELHWSQLEHMIEFLDHIKIESYKPVIIITHHCPIMNPNTLKNNIIDNLTLAFYNELDDLLIEYNKQIKAWIYGHTHHACNIVYHNVKIVSNPMGYLGEIKECKFPIATINI